MKNWLGIILIAMIGTATAAEYEITIDVDEALDGDLTTLETLLSAASDGDSIGKSQRGIAMRTIGEVELLVEGRIDELGSVTLDDGTMVDLTEADILVVKRRSRAQPTLSFSQFRTPSGQTHTRPCAIQVCLPNAAEPTQISQGIPGTRVNRGPFGKNFPSKCLVQRHCKIKH